MGAMNGPSITRAGAFVASLLAVLVVGALAVVACGGAEQAATTEPTGAAPAAEPATPTERVSFSFTTSASGMAVPRQSPAFTTQGGPLTARLVVDRWYTAPSSDGWGPATIVWAGAPGFAYDEGPSPEAKFELTEGPGKYEAEIMNGHDEYPVAGEYILHVDGAHFDGTLTVLEETTSSTSPPAASPSLVKARPSPTASAEVAGPIAAVSYAAPPAPPEKAITAGTVGWKFTPRVDIKITALGCYDADQDGLELGHRVGMFKGHPERLLASVTVRPKSTLDGAFRWESLKAPLVLKAGEAYLVGTADRQQVERFNMESTCETLYEGEGQWAPQIAFGGLRSSYRFGGPAFRAPTIAKQTNAFIQVTWMSPNFKFVQVSAD